MKGIGTRRVRVAAVAAAMLCFLAANNNVDGTSLFTHYSGQACEDSSSETLLVTSRMACQAECMKALGCMAYTFSDSEGRCQLKESCLSKTSNQDNFSGERMSNEDQKALEMAALLEFQSSVEEESIEGCHIGKWDAAEDYCSWPGVGCNAQNLTASITMKGCDLKAELPESLGKLESLTYLNLASNRFYGTIPTAWATMPSLQVLYLEANHLDGSLPGLLQMPKLKHLDLSKNSIQGTLPRLWMDTMPSLEVLDLADNNIVGKLPQSWLAKMEKLKTLNLEQNSLDGPLPAEWGSHSGCLKHIFLSENELTGTLPAEWAGLGCLTYLDLSSNELTGALPTSWGRLRNMQEMYLCENNFHGLIPSSWYVLPEITDLCLDGHAYQPALNIAAEEGRKLWIFNFQRNYDWTCPMSNWNQGPNSPADIHCTWDGITCDPLRRVTAIKLPGCKIPGGVPTEFATMSSLLELDLSGNKLTGSLPIEYSELSQQLARLILTDNRISGSLPSQYSIMNSLRVLDVSKNSISGSLPLMYDSMESIQDINLCCNKLWGSLPDSWGQSAMPIQKLFLCSNHLEGTLPSSWAALPDLAIMNLARNSLYGELNGDWGNIRSLVSLNLTTNKFDGGVPESWEGLERLQYAGLCDNRLNGQYAARLSLAWPSADVCIEEQGFSIAFPDETRDLCVMPAEPAPDHLDLSKTVFQPPGSCKHGSEVVALNGTWQKLEDGVTCLCIDEDFEICDDGMLLIPEDEDGDDEEEKFEMDMADGGKHGELDSFSGSGEGNKANPETEGKESDEPVMTDDNRVKESSAVGQVMTPGDASTGLNGHNQDLNGGVTEAHPSTLDPSLPADTVEHQASDDDSPLIGTADSPDAIADYKYDGGNGTAYPSISFVDMRTSVIGPSDKADEGKGGVVEPQDAMPEAQKQQPMMEEHGFEAIKDEHEETHPGEKGDNDISGPQNTTGEEDDQILPSSGIKAKADENNESPSLQDMGGMMGVAEAVQGDVDLPPLMAPAAPDDNSSRDGDESIGGISHSIVEDRASGTDESLDGDAGRKVADEDTGINEEKDDMLDSEDSRAMIIKPTQAGMIIMMFALLVITTLLVLSG